jgi:LytS/YehU family sensor histidine kinase
MLLFVGVYLFYSMGFRFSSIASAITDCLLFLLCIYAGRWLCNSWYLKNKLVFFAGYTLLTILLIACVKWILFKYIFNHPYAGFLELSREIMPFFLVGLVLGILLKLIRASLQKELLDAHIKTEQKAIEFNLLQAQLSPHFLFNVLNNLYGISINEQERIPGLLLKLSGLLRYTVYGAKKPFVLLKDEVEYIRNYIEFEQIRISDRLNLVTDIVSVSNLNIKIAPQVLIVFIENAFKHSKNSLEHEIEIIISLKIIDNFICLHVSNSYQKKKVTATQLNESSGLGLVNTIQRLDLLYGSDYEMTQDLTNEHYNVNLRLKIIE